MAIRIAKLTPEVFDELVAAGLISPLESDKNVNELEPETILVDDINVCTDQGGHKQIVSGINVSWPKFTHWHPAKEEVFLLSAVETKPLYLIFGYDRYDVFLRKLEEGSVQESDLIIVETVFNDPRVCAFSVNPWHPHGEFTCAGAGRNPRLIVTEPTDMPTNMIDVSSIRGMVEAAFCGK